MNSPIRKRRVFYVSGFDPRGVSAYHRLFSDESRKQAARQGIDMEISERERTGTWSSLWRSHRRAGKTAAAASGAGVETTFEFLHWDDIVREHWHSGYQRLYRMLPAVYWQLFFTTGLAGKVFRVSKWPVMTGLAPALVFLGIPVLAVFAGWGAYAGVGHLFPQMPVAALFAAVCAVIAAGALGWWLERAFTLGWLLRTYAFVLGYGQGRIPALDQRVDEFSRRLLDYVETAEDDEIVLVGHSVGANVAVSVLARAAQLKPDLCSRHPPVGLLTLGGTIPMQGLMPTASRFRDELARLATEDDLSWVDVSAYEDAASFPLVNPVQASGVAAGSGTVRRPQVISGAFREKLEPATYHRAVWNLFRMHFQYLMASERDVPHDYFAITTGSLSFRDRFRRPD